MMKYFHSWSGGKDSTAAIILDHIHGLPPSRIVFCEVMYDRKNGISGELPEHIDFVKNVAIPKFTEWGFTVDLITAETDYLENFFHIISKSRNGNNGKNARLPVERPLYHQPGLQVKADPRLLQAERPETVGIYPVCRNRDRRTGTA